MATYWYNSMLCKFLNPNYAWHNDFTTRSNSTGLKNSYKTAQKTNVEPGMATYWYNSMLYKFLNPNYAWHNDLTTQSNSTGLKNSYKTAQKTNGKKCVIACTAQHCQVVRSVDLHSRAGDIHV